MESRFWFPLGLPGGNHFSMDGATATYEAGGLPHVEADTESPLSLDC